MMNISIIGFSMMTTQGNSNDLSEFIGDYQECLRVSDE